MKLSRYSASGTTQSSGTGATSVVIQVVTASMRPEGMAERTTHCHGWGVTPEPPQGATGAEPPIALGSRTDPAIPD